MVLGYRIVPPSEAHIVVSRGGKFVVSSDDTISQKRDYFAFPEGIPFIGRKVRILNVTIKEITLVQETYEQNQARYQVSSSLKYRIKNVLKAAETFTNDNILGEQISDILRAAVRAVTVKYDVTQVRALKQKMEEEIRKEMEDDLERWGLELINFQLGEFLDTKDSTIISDISKRREVEIHTTTREQNAEKIRQARVKEAEAEEQARTREIAKDKTIAEREQNKIRDIAEQERLTKEKQLDVTRVATIKQAEIDKDKASVKAEQDKRVAVIAAEQQKAVMEIEKERAAIEKEKKHLEGLGDRLKAEESAKGAAAPILANLLAEAEGKVKLQEALSKFDDKAIRALTAEQIVAMQKEVGIATANALQNADVRLFAGSEGKKGFEMGEFFTSVGISNESLLSSVMNRISRPNDLGFNKSIEGVKDTKATE